MSYIINNSRGNVVAIIADGTVNTTATDLALVGRAVTNYGTSENENYVYLLENFANSTAPLQPILGQLWYNSNTDIISAYSGANTWVNLASVVSPAFIGIPTAPTAANGTSTTQIATTAYVQNQLSSSSGITTVGNITGGNLLTSGLVSATGNITGNFVNGNGYFLTGIITSVANINNGTSNVNIAAANANVTVSVNGTANVAVFATTGEYITGILSASGTITGGNVLTGGLISATSTITSAANITGGNVLTGGLISATANITGGNVISGGTRVYKYTASATVPSNGVAGDNWYATGTDKLYMYINDGTTNQWVDQSFPTSISSLAINGNLSVGGTLSAANITFSGGGSLSVSNLLNSGANGVGNIGNSTTRFNTVFATTFSGVSTTANYADLAENYQADGVYTPGTVVVFGGKNEITVSDIDHDTRIAGVVSTNPAYLMNSAQINGTPVALAGRVPCLVQGPVTKGDRLVNVASGVAGKFDPGKAEPGCVVGKSLQDLPHDHVEIIEIAVGRT